MHRFKIDPKSTSVLLLLVFLFALTAQGIHQASNPAKPLKECEQATSHLHQDSQSHSCQLCDYKINSQPGASVFSSIIVHVPVSNIAAIASVYFKKIRLNTRRGPPCS